MNVHSVTIANVAGVQAISEGHFISSTVLVKENLMS